MYLKFQIDKTMGPQIDFVCDYGDNAFNIDDYAERISSFAHGYVKKNGYLKKRLIDRLIITLEGTGYVIVTITTKPNTIFNRIKRLFGRTINDGA